MRTIVTIPMEVIWDSGLGIHNGNVSLVGRGRRFLAMVELLARSRCYWLERGICHHAGPGSRVPSVSDTAPVSWQTVQRSPLRPCDGMLVALPRAERPLVIFLGSYQLTCQAAQCDDGANDAWSAGWRIDQIGLGKPGELAGARLSPIFPDHRSAMAAARIAGMVTLEAMHAEAQRQLEYA